MADNSSYRRIFLAFEFAIGCLKSCPQIERDDGTSSPAIVSRMSMTPAWHLFRVIDLQKGLDVVRFISFRENSFRTAFASRLRFGRNLTQLACNIGNTIGNPSI